MNYRNASGDLCRSKYVLFIIIIIVLSFVQAQDTLITKTGTEYIGKLVSIDEMYVTFYYENDNPTVPIRTVERISLESGANINLDISQPSVGDSIAIQNMNNVRGLIALEKIAFAQMFFVYYAIISIGIMVWLATQ